MHTEEKVQNQEGSNVAVEEQQTQGETPAVTPAAEPEANPAEEKKGDGAYADDDKEE